MAPKKEGFFKKIWRVLCAIGRGLRSFWQWYKSIFVGRPWWVKTISAIASFVVIMVVYSAMVFFNFLWLFGKSPSISSIMNPKTSNASYVYSADGQLLCKFFDENRSPVKYEEVSPQFFQALIDTEDERFHDHMGVDFAGMAAAAKDFVVHRRARGASTITQQLVKNMFKVRTEYSTGLLGKIPGLGMLIMKTKEMLLAFVIEMKFSKDEIITMYANTVDFGNNAFGIKTAARTYYNTTPDSLSVDQSATLVGLLKATSSYNPKKNPKRSMQRRNVVLHNMVTHGHLADADYQRMKDEPTPLHFTVENATTGRAQYFRNAIDSDEQLKEWRERNGVNFYTDGLKIYTTLDTRIQAHAEDAVLEKMYEIQQRFNSRWGDDPCWVDEEGNEVPGFVESVAKKSPYYKVLESKFPNNADSIRHYMNTKREMRMFEYRKEGGKVVAASKMMNISPMDSVAYMLHFMHAGLVAMDPRNGFVKAWVGDIDYKTWQYDKVTASRQCGSTFKLFVYAAAMEQGLTPCDTELDEVFHWDVYNENKGVMEDYSPHNANGRCTGGQMTFREAFARSVNIVAVRVGKRVGFSNVRATAEVMGIKSPLRPDNANEDKPAMCLGSMDVNLEELVNGYCTVANYGKHIDPVLVTRIVRTNPDGTEEVIYDYQEEVTANAAISARAAYFMQRLLSAGVTDGGGTSQSLSAYVDPYMSSTDFGGKTGTSNNYSDAWFVGTTPNLVAGVWVGGEYRCIHFTTGSQGQGSRTALPICGRFFQKVWADRQLRPLVTAKYVGINGLRNALDCAYEYQPEERDYADTASAAATDEEEEITVVTEGAEATDDPAPAPLPIEPGQE
ncbi:MAG: transglycosylase domain-containing protein [Bacteroidales bacterium]|nr:transglycosylase domain-containing protein [Bacteroidales bacterium]